MGYLPAGELEREIKIFFEEIVRMVTEEDRPLNVVAVLEKDIVFEEGRKIFELFMKNTRWD